MKRPQEATKAREAQGREEGALQSWAFFPPLRRERSPACARSGAGALLRGWRGEQRELVLRRGGQEERQEKERTAQLLKRRGWRGAQHAAHARSGRL